MRGKLVAAVVATMLVASPALAGFKLMPSGKPVQIRKTTLMVTPPRDWNRLGSRIGRNAESWTLDGLSLNDVTFYGGVLNDETLFREVNKKERPLPRFSSTMLMPDVAGLFEGSYRVANGTSIFSIDSMEPGTFAGQDGFRFTYSFTLQSDEVRRKGEAYGAIVDGKLYMATFEAPVIHYYDRDIESFRSLIATAWITPAAKPR